MTIAASHHSHKPELDREELRDVIRLSLWAGQMLLQSGADTKRVEETVHKLGTGLGADWMDIVITPDAIIATTINNYEFRTKVRRAPSRGVNFSVIAEVTDLSFRVQSGEIDRFALGDALVEIAKMKPHYNRWTVVFTVGLACGAFNKLFGGDDVTFLVTIIAASTAMFVRQELHHRNFNALLNWVVTAFVAGIIASLVERFGMSPVSGTAMSASVLLLVPGVPLIDSIEDFLNGHINNGVSRTVWGALLSLGIAAGLSLAIYLMGVNGL
ncbi:threonine/serine exporter family protein [Phototrophicus methaneseepsis]|uniref:Threonine/serine exporter family protein n=1 Tax=Phototrophicus methaneseepsis TaxID=2710758 RepID=A0A7S8IE27_9CHLR|nr:threonine/serine exporter family protein [Phototrophicus methaneseepsis]QPC81989.1 threonine/serine exporter family protein [Phototrophicus methaneseepsis]